ncbi:MULTISPECIES: pyruvate:ferredoxin (flavodoxin) oxidoreductase [Mycolicibacterium]|nr:MULTISPECIES: pyruvate:ferredoxin (flavodoxin) oxidoreductase [Mycolicibacterium]MCV7130571.1 pyruvate:ferredoxin (flavodoxin) oxidoreductase [Mycolicibacterium vanbaalenii PYR-1]MDN4521963.1 pyruvate:ferredoxin (flavodoxin) oxidoreductase [Mycolicibacterium austroafricanum]QRZ10027.1 pyruvate:ferredoxin (flavodoxin) oxidoreductase [Mycolicibacterium austroafricanum]QZT71460.1 pyruvate:ferredoxin (flavodoxin) oxidoreductase [Mycolicibacterium austroafricanum]
MMRVAVDGNEAAVSVAYRLNEVCCIYPITPSSPMAELADEWSAAERTNVWGAVPTVVEMQSEGGAAGALHGALQSGALTTTYTSSQGLLLMIPNMYKIAGELTSAVIHVAARSIAAQGLSIFGDHSDVMAVRQTGFALLGSASVQEAHDLALVAQAATLATRVPFVHFFDGFRTSHEINTIETLSDDDLRSLVPEELIWAHRERALSPERPFIRGTAQNPDVYFQARETVNPFYARVPGVVEDLMARLGERTGRAMHIVDYSGHPEAERVLVLMGSGAETVQQTVAALVDRGERVGVVQVRLYRPFPTAAFLESLPATVRAVGVLDRTKEPGSIGEPLYLDVVAALAGACADGDRAAMPRVTGGRYGLSSKEFTPAMVAGVLTELASERSRRQFTVGIDDDVSRTSVEYDPSFDIESPETVRAVFFGLGSDGTVSANKNTIKILGSEPGLHAQAYFVYDSKKSGSQTESHLRFGPHPIRAPYLVTAANFIGCHQFRFLDKVDVLGRAAPGATLLLNCRLPAERIWDALPRRVQEQILDKKITLYVVDADRIARAAGLPGRINIVLQTCFFAISEVLPRDRAIDRIKDSVRKTYGNRGPDVLAAELAAVDGAVAGLQRIEVPTSATSIRVVPPPVPESAPEFVRTVTAEMMAGRGNALPVSALPVDGTYPSGTTAYEKRNISELVAVWDPDTCIQCGNCGFVCPHSVIRSKFYDGSQLAGAPADFDSAPLDAVGLPGARFSLQVYTEDCTGCGLCVEACPVVIPGPTATKAINLGPAEPRMATERENVRFFESLPTNDRSRVDFGTVRGTQFLEPLFEFSGACAGCGETPYVKLLSQLFGDRLMVANATGCSSIYGGSLPTTPWTTNAEGRGPAWSNSLFEDNAEFGLGMRLAGDAHVRLARRRLTELRDTLGGAFVDAILDAPQRRESELAAQRERVAELRDRLACLDAAVTTDLLSVVDHLVRRSVWIVGGDGWAYDIGSGGLDHVLATGHNVNVLVLDTEVYSNTGGQMSKATPLGAVAKFAAAGKTVPLKDLALQAIAYGNVYVARVAMGADPQQTLQAFREAEAYDGPSLVIAYSQCIAHGIDMRLGMDQQYRAVASGHWPLLRFDPVMRAAGKNPFLLDSHRPRIALEHYRDRELRYRSLSNADPVEAERLLGLAEQAIEQRWNVYEAMASQQRSTKREHLRPDARREP